MAINISHPTNTIDGQDVLNLKSGNSSNIELTPDSGTVNVNGDINITGNFRVQGTTTTVNSTTTSIVDPIIVLGTDEDGNPANVNDGKDRGVSFFYNNGTTKTGFFGFDASNNDFRFIPNATITNEIVTGSDGTITINRLNSVDIYTDTLNTTSTITAVGLVSSGTGFSTGGYLSVDGSSDLHNTHILGDLLVDDNTTTTTLDAGNLNITTNVISSDVTGNIVLDPGTDSIDVSNSNIINLLDPTADQDAATKKYVDDATSAISILNIAGDFGTGTVDLDLGTFTLNGTTHQIQTTVTNDVITFSLPTTLIAPGTVEVTTDLTVNNNTTTTTLDAGNLNITTNVISSSVSGNVVIDSGTDAIELIGNTNVTGNLDVSGNITLGGNITIGDQAVDTVNVVADFTSNLIPQADLTYNLGSTSKKWNNLYVGTVTGNVTGQVSDISNHTTTDLAEGTRLYYTTARTRADVNAGTGLTYTAASGEFKITDTGVATGTYGDSSTIPIITINAQGQITTVTTTSVAGVTDFDYDITNGNLTIATADGGSYVATVTLDPFTTTDLIEGTNQYYTSQRVRDELSAVDSGGDGSFSYDDTTGTFTYTGPSATETRAHFTAGTGLTYTAGEFKITDTNVNFGTYGTSTKIPQLIINAQGQITSATEVSVAGVSSFTYDNTTGSLTIGTADGNSFIATVNLDPFTTDTLDEGTTNQYYLDSRARAAISVTKVSGDGNLTYDNTNGIISYTGPSDSEARAHFTAGTGVHLDYTTGIVSIGQEVETTSDVDFNNVDTVTLDAGNLNITTNVISSDISGDIVIDSGADSIELIGDTNVTGNLSVSVDAVIYGNLTVQGTTTSINTTDTEITDNVLVLNQGEVGAGVSRGTSGIEIARGSLFNATWKWNEATQRWEAKEGTSLTAIAVSEISAGNVNIANNTIVPTDTNGDLNLNSNGTGQVLINGRQVATDTDALMYAIVFGG